MVSGFIVRLLVLLNRADVKHEQRLKLERDDASLFTYAV
jgi:hypothetical protein